MKKNFYLQHSLMAMNDPRMKTLIAEEGLKGFGAYWFILEKLELLPEPYAQMEYLQPYCTKKIPLPYIGKIIANYQLFIIDEDGFFSPAELNPARNKDKKIVEKEQETVESNEINAHNRTKFNDNLQILAQKARRKDTKICAEILVKSQLNSDLSEIDNCNTKENIKDKIITAATEEKEETAAAAESSSEVLATGGQPPLTPGITLTVCDDFGQPQRPPYPIRPWRQLVDDLTKDSYWLDLAYLKCGYGDLLRRHIKKAVELFKQHIEVYDKGGDLLRMSDVHAYFINFVRIGSRTSMPLRDALNKLDANSAPTDNPYRFEQRIDGRRAYLGCPIPDYAPPRPDENAIWNDQTRSWTSPK